MLYTSLNPNKIRVYAIKTSFLLFLIFDILYSAVEAKEVN